MKKYTVLFFIVMSLLLVIGCSNTEVKVTKTKEESLVGYMVIEDDKLHFDKVEIIREEDKERIAELGLNQQDDMPNGYYIYNEDTEKQTYELTKETVYSFVDINLLFIDNADGDRVYTTTKRRIYSSFKYIIL